MGGRISQCLAAKHRLHQGCEAARLDMNIGLIAFHSSTQKGS